MTEQYTQRVIGRHMLQKLCLVKKKGQYRASITPWITCWKCNFPMTRSVCASVGLSVGQSVCLPWFPKRVRSYTCMLQFPIKKDSLPFSSPFSLFSPSFVFPFPPSPLHFFPFAWIETFSLFKIQTFTFLNSIKTVHFSLWKKSLFIEYFSI